MSTLSLIAASPPNQNRWMDGQYERQTRCRMSQKISPRNIYGITKGDSGFENSTTPKYKENSNIQYVYYIY